MKNDQDVEEGFKSREYPSGRKSREPLNYRHVDDAAGRVFLLVCCFMAKDCVGSWETMKAVTLTRKFKEAGLDKDKLFIKVNAVVPDYAAYYKLQAGKELTAHIMYMRAFHKNFYDNDGNRPREGREGPLSSKKLRARFGAVEARLRHNPRPIPLVEMMELGK